MNRTDIYKFKATKIRRSRKYIAHNVVISKTNNYKAKVYFTIIFNIILTLYLFIFICNIIGSIVYSFTYTCHFKLTIFISFIIILAATRLGFQKYVLKLLLLLGQVFLVSLAIKIYLFTKKIRYSKHIAGPNKSFSTKKVINSRIKSSSKSSKRFFSTKIPKGEDVITPDILYVINDINSKLNTQLNPFIETTEPRYEITTNNSDGSEYYTANN